MWRGRHHFLWPTCTLTNRTATLAVEPYGARSLQANEKLLLWVVIIVVVLAVIGAVDHKHTAATGPNDVKACSALLKLTSSQNVTFSGVRNVVTYGDKAETAAMRTDTQRMVNDSRERQRK